MLLCLGKKYEGNLFMTVPLLDLKKQFDQIGLELISEMTRVMESQQYIGGKTVEKFESDFASYCGAKHAQGCANGTDAIYLALKAIGIGPGDKVITTPFSFFGTASPIARLGAEPVFADIDPVTFNLNPLQVEKEISGKTKAIMPVHLFGQISHSEELLSLAAKYRIPLIEDAAQAVGAREHGKMAGSIGDLATFSFYPTKNLNAAGDAGLVTSNNNILAKEIISYRNHGEQEKYTHHNFGLNSRLDALQAAILSVKLRYLDEWTEKRRQNARRYEEMFAAASLSDQITLPEWDRSDGKQNRHVFHQYTIRCRQRNRLKNHLLSQGIGCAIHYPVVIYMQPAFRGYNYAYNLCPEAEKATAEVLSLPIFPELTEAQQQEVVDRIAGFYK
jgi:dTDP-4-amino-4,6-dideoxygalactose transaminase